MTDQVSHPGTKDYTIHPRGEDGRILHTIPMPPDESQVILPEGAYLTFYNRQVCIFQQGTTEELARRDEERKANNRVGWGRNMHGWVKSADKMTTTKQVGQTTATIKLDKRLNRYLVYIDKVGDEDTYLVKGPDKEGSFYEMKTAKEAAEHGIKEIAG